MEITMSQSQYYILIFDGATTSPVIIKKFFTAVSVCRKRINNDIKISTIEPMENSNFSNSRCSLPILNKPQLKNNGTRSKIVTKNNDKAQQQNNNCTCSDGTRKRVKSNNNNRCATFFSQLSSSSVSSTDGDSSAESSANFSSINVCDTNVVESHDQFDPTAAPKKRNSLDERTINNIRRSWSHIEVRHFKGLFKRNRDNDVKRRNSYAHTTSTRANQQIASESEFKVLNLVHNVDNASNDADENSTSSDEVDHSPPKKLPVDLYALQANMEKETDAVTRARQMRKFIISEIYSTEQSYLAHMRTLKKIFMDPCIQASLTPHPLMIKDDVEIIFAHIDELINLSDTIVESFEISMDPWEDYDSKMGQVFLKYGNKFEVFEKYAENIQRSRQLLAKKVNQSVLYRKFVSSQRKKENIKLNLNDYMIMPIQRITRYSLLLKELKKHTLESHTDYKDMCEALDSMLSLASRCNNNIQ
ncbi:3988_t:CDS:2 [Funneliformis caledonium]|uniref:3988_t:CDS:1 n=1 Tax=Funneliformis caledonium TaxID=1117310 RepID=A0A9N9BTX3_9GLOM|nr:3988_t:CDS:2 [Funneliformis caledonium]